MERSRRHPVWTAGLAALGALCLARRARAQAGLTAAQILTRPYSARAIGMGGAFSAIQDAGLDSLGYNPAGPASLRAADVETAYSAGVFGDNFGFFGAAVPAGPVVLSGGYLYDNAGTIDLNLSNGTQGNVTAEEDMVGLFGASVPLDWGLSVGAVGKYMHLTLAQQATATSFAADAGALWRTPLKGLSVGAAVQNMGPDVTYEKVGDPLPLSERVGAAYHLPWAEYSHGMFDFIQSYEFAADLVKERDQTSYGALGAEIESALLDLRVGYDVDASPQTLSLGFGIKERGFRFDYAMNLMGDLGEVHHVSVGYRF